jgi:sugar phosphate isomerase/epimerase
MATPGLGHKGAIKLAKKYGFQGVDIRCSLNYWGEVTEETDEAVLRQIAGDFRAAGIAMPGVLCYNKVQNEEPDCWQRLAKDLAHLLAMGARLGAGAVRVFGGYAKGEQTMDEFTANWAEAIRRTLDENNAPVDIILQNHNKSYNAREAVKLAETVDHPRFGLAFSPDHCLIQKEEGIEEIFEAARPWTKELYVSDVKVVEGKHKTVFPGEGDLPLADIVRHFDDTDFDGYYCFKWEKIWIKDLPDADEALPVFVKFMDAV